MRGQAEKRLSDGHHPFGGIWPLAIKPRFTREDFHDRQAYVTNTTTENCKVRISKSHKSKIRMEYRCIAIRGALTQVDHSTIVALLDLLLFQTQKVRRDCKLGRDF